MLYLHVLYFNSAGGNKMPLKCYICMYFILIQQVVTKCHLSAIFVCVLYFNSAGGNKMLLKCYTCMYFANIRILNDMTSQDLEIKQILKTADPECRKELPGKKRFINI